MATKTWKVENIGMVVVLAVVYRKTFISSGDCRAWEKPRYRVRAAGTFFIVADQFWISATTFSNLWKRFVSNGHVGETRRPKLTQSDKDMIEYLKKESPATTGKEYKTGWRDTLLHRVLLTMLHYNSTNMVDPLNNYLGGGVQSM